MKNSTENQNLFLPRRGEENIKKMFEKGRSFFAIFAPSRFMAVFFIFVIFAHPIWAGKDDKLTAEEACQKVEEAQSAAKDVQMDLNMDVKDTLSGSSQSMKGKIQIKSPDLVYVHYTQPTEQFLYIGGSLVQMYQPDQKMVYQQRGGKTNNSAPVYVGVGKQLEKYAKISKVSFIKDSDSEVGLLFKPLDALSAGFDTMKVYIHKKDWWPYQMEVETPSTLTKAKFSNFSFNQGLSDSLFHFTVPKGVRVVDGEVF
jgi:outer membrane lipoprotein-sorting protein